MSLNQRRSLTNRTNSYTGFKAEVTYEGEAKYPQYVPASPEYQTKKYSRAHYKPEYKSKI